MPKHTSEWLITLCIYADLTFATFFIIVQALPGIIDVRFKEKDDVSSPPRKLRLRSRKLLVEIRAERFTIFINSSERLC